MPTRLLPFALFLCLTGAAVAQTRQIDTARGPVEVPEEPETIAVFDVAAVDTLDALGVSVAGTVDTLFVDYLDDVAAGATDLGSFFEPDAERVHALSPDLIIVGGRSSDQMRSLSRIATTVDMTIGVNLVADASARLRTYGDLFSRTDEARVLQQALTDQLAKARAAAQDRGDVLIVMTNGPKISAYGAGGRFGWLHNDVGLPQAAPEIGTSIHGEAISFEFIRQTDPDWLIVIDRLAAIGRPGEGAAATLDNVIVQQTKAWRFGQVIYLDAANIYVAGGGVQGLMRTLDELIDGFNAD